MPAAESLAIPKRFEQRPLQLFLCSVKLLLHRDERVLVLCLLEMSSELPAAPGFETLLLGL